MKYMKLILQDKTEVNFDARIIRYSKTLENEFNLNKDNPKYALVVPESILFTKTISEIICKFLTQLDVIISKYGSRDIKEILSLQDTFVSHMDQNKVHSKQNTPKQSKPKYSKPKNNNNNTNSSYNIRNSNSSNSSSGNSGTNNNNNNNNNIVYTNLSNSTSSSISNSSLTTSVVVDGEEFQDFGAYYHNGETLQSVSLDDDVHYPKIELSDQEYYAQPQQNDSSGDDISDNDVNYNINSGHNKKKHKNTVLYSIYNLIDIKGMGTRQEKDNHSQLEALVLSADYLAIKENLLVRAIRYQLETTLGFYDCAHDVGRFLTIKSDFDMETRDKIKYENNFEKIDPFQKHEDLFESMVDGPSGAQSFAGVSRPDIVQDVRKRRLMIAIKDASVNVCHGCDSAFGLRTRRHHCRECGYIFCDNCTSNRIDYSSIQSPKYLDSFDYYSGRQLRVCNSCHTALIEKKEFGYVEQMLRILALKFKLLRRFSSICTLWRKAAVCYLSDIREIQYLFPTHTFQQFEIEALWRNKESLVGHSKWVLKLLESINWDGLSESKVQKVLNIINAKEKTMSCYHMMCSSSCQFRIPMKDIFPLLDKDVTNQHIRNFAVDIISEIADDKLIYFIPQLVYFLRYDNEESKLQEFLFNRSLESKTIAHFVMWELKNCQTSSSFDSRYEILKSKLLISLGKEEALNYISGFKFLDLLQQFPQQEGMELDNKMQLLNELLSKYKILYPTDPRYTIKRVVKGSVSNSATKPIRLEATCINNSDGSECTKILFFKKDDIRKDRIVLNIISMMTFILSENIPIIDQEGTSGIGGESYDNMVQERYRSPLQKPNKSNSAFNYFVRAVDRGHYDEAYNILKNDQDVRTMIAITKPATYNKIVEVCESRQKIEDLKENPFKDFLSANGSVGIQDFKETLKSEIQIILNSIVTYSVMPSGSQYGFIDAVQDSITLSDIYKNHKNANQGVDLPIHTYLLKEGKCPITESHKNFAYSLAFWMVMTHFLGVGDRHLDNIMITNNGKFFHIDYGFILGKEPKPVANYIRYSQEYLSTSSLTNNINFNAICSLIFGILRREAPFFLYHLMFLTRMDSTEGSSKFTNTYIQNEVANRFFPGLPSHDSIKYFENLLDSHKDSMSQKITDATREFSKMTPAITQSVTDIASTSLSSFGSMIKNFRYWNNGYK